jgi:hypothetical protein
MLSTLDRVEWCQPKWYGLEQGPVVGCNGFFLLHHREWFLVNDQLDAQLFSMYLFQFSTCFEQPRAHHQENQVYQYNIWFVCLFVFGTTTPQWARSSSFMKFLDHTWRRTTVGRTPLDEWSARRRTHYLTTHNTHSRQTSMPPVGFKPTISAGERP